MAQIQEDTFIAEGARIVGDVTIADECGIWYNAVIRADAEPVVIRARTNIQDNATVHVSPGFPCTIGEGVSVGHNAVVHGCVVGDNTLIGMGAIIMNGAVVGEGCIVGAGAVVMQDTIIPDRSVVVGCPARVLKHVDDEQFATIRNNAEHYMDLASEALAELRLD